MRGAANGSKVSNQLRRAVIHKIAGGAAKGSRKLTTCSFWRSEVRLFLLPFGLPRCFLLAGSSCSPAPSQRHITMPNVVPLPNLCWTRVAALITGHSADVAKPIGTDYKAHATCRHDVKANIILQTACCSQDKLRLRTQPCINSAWFQTLCVKAVNQS